MRPADGDAVSKVRGPVPAVQGFHCAECGHRLAKGEPVYNLGNRRICTVCWSKPPETVGGVPK